MATAENSSTATFPNTIVGITHALINASRYHALDRLDIRQRLCTRSWTSTDAALIVLSQQVTIPAGMNW